MKLNEKIFEYRKCNNWSQEELADKLNVSRQTVSKWEVGKAVPELEKLIKLSELFNISIDELVKEDAENENSQNKTEIFERISDKLKKRKQLISNCITAILISIIIIVGYEIVSKEVNLKIRENNIEKVMQYYNEFSSGECGYFAIERYSKKENDTIVETNTHYYLYYKDGKELAKAIEYEGNNSDKIIKEVYVDLSKINHYDWQTEKYFYDDVVEIYVDDWTYKTFDNYEFVAPLQRIRNALNERYFDIAEAAKVIAEDEKNNIIAVKFPKHNTEIYSWNFGNKENLNREDVMDLYLVRSNNWMSFYLDDYKNDIAETREIVSLQISKLNANIEDVTIPEL